MKAYIDSSIILRMVCAEKNALKLPKNVNIYAANEILKIECFRTIERMKFSLSMSDDDVSQIHASLHKTIHSLHIIKFNDAINKRASEPFPISLKTLDAIHLSTAILWKEQEKNDILFLTHDLQLAKVARSVGFEVIGA